MVKSRSSTSSIFRSTRPSISESSLAGYDTDSVITFRPSPTKDTGHHRPPPLDLTGSKLSVAPLSRSGLSLSPSSPFSPSLPVTPGTPPSQFPSDPFSHPTTLPEPTRARPGSLAHSFGPPSKGPEIIIASPSTSTIHYLFPSAPSSTGLHLRAAEVGRSGSQRRRGSAREKPHPADAFSASTRKGKEESVQAGRTSRLASEPIITGIRESKTFDSEAMRTLRRQPSLADIGSRNRAGKENVGMAPLATLVEEKKNHISGLRVSTSSIISDLKLPASPIRTKSDISSPVLLSPRATNSSRRRSLSLSSPRPAPTVPSPSRPAEQHNMPTSPQAHSPSFSRPLRVDVGDVMSSSDYTNSPTSPVQFTNPFPVPCGGVAMERGYTKVGCGDAKLIAKLDAERRLAAYSRNRPQTQYDGGVAMRRMSPITEIPAVSSYIDNDLTNPNRSSLSGRMRRSLSLKHLAETKSTRRRSQSVSAKSESRFDISHPLPFVLSPTATYSLGLGDPAVDTSDKYGLARIVPSASRSTGLGLDVRIDEVGQRSPQRKRIDLGGSDISLLASTTTGSRSMTGLGFSSSTFGSGGSPSSLPGSLMEEAIDLTGCNGRGSSIMSGKGIGSGSGNTSYTTSTSSRDDSSFRTTSLRPSLSPALSTGSTSTPYLQSQSQMTSPNFPSPQPATPHFDQLSSPAIINSPQSSSSASPRPTPTINIDHATQYDISSRKPNLRHSKSFTSDVSARVSRSFSWRSKPTLNSTQKYEVGTGQYDQSIPEGDDKEKKEKRLSKSFSFTSRSKMRSRSPVPMELLNSPPIIQLAFPTPAPASVRPPKSNQQLPSYIPAHTIISTAKNTQVRPTPMPIPTIRPIHLSPQLSVTAPNSPSTSTRGSPRLTPESASPASTSGRSPFLSASSSFRGFTKGLTKSISRTFDRSSFNKQQQDDKLNSVREADSALKARISHPLEAATKHERGSSKEWRAGLLNQVVSTSMEKGLNEMTNDHRSEMANISGKIDGDGERTSWSRSVGKTFGLRSSSSASTGFMSVGSIPKKSELKPLEGTGRRLGDIGKEDSIVSIYSTASFLPPPAASGSTVAQPPARPIKRGPPIHITHSSPPKSPPPPTINYSHPRSNTPPSIPLPPSPPIIDLPEFPLVPVRLQHQTSPTRSNYTTEYSPQPLLGKLSNMPGSEALTQGKEERVRKVMLWRKDIGDGEVGDDIGVKDILEGVFDDLAEGELKDDNREDGEEEVERDDEEGGRLDGLIRGHVEREGKRLKGIVGRKSVELGKGSRGL